MWATLNNCKDRGEGSGCMVDKPDLGKYQPSCLLAHELVNKLSVVVGYCDLLRDHVPDDSPGQVQLRKIR